MKDISCIQRFTKYRCESVTWNYADHSFKVKNIKLQIYLYYIFLKHVTTVNGGGIFHIWYLQKHIIKISKYNNNLAIKTKLSSLLHAKITFRKYFRIKSSKSQTHPLGPPLNPLCACALAMVKMCARIAGANLRTIVKICTL